MTLQLKNKRVLVTGSTSGIGLALAREFVRHDCLVMVNGRSPEKVTARSVELGCQGCCADVTEVEGAKFLASEALRLLGGVDILVCNVGNGRSVPPGHETLREWRRVFDQNLFSATNMISETTQLLTKSKGSIVCVSSICGSEVIPNAPVTYSAAKAALNAFIAGIARPLGKLGVRINAVSPGNVIFEGSVWQEKLKEKESEVTEMLQREVSLERFANLDEIAAAVTFLASESSSFTTGAILIVDGGQVRSS